MPLQFKSGVTQAPTTRYSVPLETIGGTASRTTSRGVRDIDATLLIAALLTIALYFVPWAGYVTYPIRLLVTFVHEGSHALAALLTGGWVHGLQINPDASGVTQTSGGVQGLISSAGYLGATLYGAVLLALLRRGVSGRKLLLATAIAVGLMTLAGILSPFTVLWGALIGGGLLLAARKLPEEGASWMAGFIGVQCVLNAFFDLKTLFQLSATTGVLTDAMNMQRATFIPAVIWSLLWMVAAAGILWTVLLRPMLKRR